MRRYKILISNIKKVDQNGNCVRDGSPCNTPLRKDIAVCDGQAQGPETQAAVECGQVRLFT